MTAARDAFAADFSRYRMVAILRGLEPASAREVAAALYEGGVRFIEVPLNSPDALKSISLIAAEYSGSGVHVGAGTVLAAEDVAPVAAAGGTYVVSPNTNPDVVRRTREAGLVSIPGFLTPTEAFAGVAAGADYLKCFPAGNMGPGYFKALRAVLKNPVLAVGGVDLGNLSEYLSHAAGIGVGSNLFSPGRPVADIRRDAAAYVSAIEKAGKRS